MPREASTAEQIEAEIRSYQRETILATVGDITLSFAQAGVPDFIAREPFSKILGILANKAEELRTPPAP